MKNPEFVRRCEDLFEALALVATMFLVDLLQEGSICALRNNNLFIEHNEQPVWLLFDEIQHDLPDQDRYVEKFAHIK